MARILVVDDEKVMVKGIRFNLENEGYTVDVGYNCLLYTSASSILVRAG